MNDPNPLLLQLARTRTRHVLWSGPNNSAGRIFDIVERLEAANVGPSGVDWVPDDLSEIWGELSPDAKLVALIIAADICTGMESSTSSG